MFARSVNGAIQAWKNGWAEVPFLMVGGVHALLGACATMLAVYLYEKDGGKRRFMYEYVIMRPDDPRVNNYRYD